MSAEDVCAVRRGLRMEFSRPSLPEMPSTPGQRTTERAGHRAGHDGRQHADADEHGHRPQTDQLDGRFGQPDDQGGDADRRR